MKNIKKTTYKILKGYFLNYTWKYEAADQIALS